MALPDSPLVAASAERILTPGEKIAGSAFERLTQPFSAQRLGPRTYWVEVALYHATVVVGEQSVLVIDPMSGGRAEALLTAIASFTDRPVSHVVYSHHHLDHISDAGVFVQAAAASGNSLEIVATDATVDLLKERRIDVATPTEVVAATGGWEFAGIPVQFTTPPSGHTRDNAIIVLPEERVAHCVDLIHPGFVEFDCFGLAESLNGYAEALVQLKNVPGWEILTAGHGNIGARADVDATVQYLAEMRSRAWDAMLAADFGAGISPDTTPWHWLHAHRNAVVERVVADMAEEWGSVPGYSECAPTHASSVYWEFSLTWAGPGT